MYKLLISLAFLAANSALALPSINSDHRDFHVNWNRDPNYKEDPSLMIVGGCSILNNYWVLSAAHCGGNPTNYQVHAGTHYLNDINGGQKRSIDKMILHPSYSSNTLDNDVMLIKLSEPLITDNKTGFIDIPTEDIKPDDTTTAIGWGSLSEGSGQASNTLQKVNLTVISNEDCKKPYGSMVTENMLCASSPAKDSCQGDSGGPLFQKSYNEDGSVKFVQYGIVSWGIGCARPAYPGVYARVFSLSKWILNTMATN